MQQQVCTQNVESGVAYGENIMSSFSIKAYHQYSLARIKDINSESETLMTSYQLYNTVFYSFWEIANTILNSFLLLVYFGQVNITECTQINIFCSQQNIKEVKYSVVLSGKSFYSCHCSCRNNNTEKNYLRLRAHFLLLFDTDSILPYNSENLDYQLYKIANSLTRAQ